MPGRVSNLGSTTESTSGVQGHLARRPSDRLFARARQETNYRSPIHIKRLDQVVAWVERCALERGVPLTAIRVLDLGCGLGGLSLPLAALGCRVLAVDMDEPMVSELAANARRRRLDTLEVATGDVGRFRRGGTFDVAIASEVLQYVPNPGTLFEAAAAHLARGGSLIVTVPNGHGPYELQSTLWFRLRRIRWLRRIARKPPPRASRTQPRANFFTQRDLIAVAASHDFRHVVTAKSDSILSALPPPLYRRMPGWLTRLNMKLADLLPARFASGWYLLFERA